MAIIIIILFLILSSSIACPEDEKQALLIFKNDLFDPTNWLASWDPHHHHLQDCCRWFGVICDNRTGHVISLNLGLTPPRDDDTDDSESYRRSRLEGTINPCLSNLKQLRYLDLSNNMFEGLPPYQLGRLSNLEYLNLGGNSGLYVENLERWSGLSSLKHLDLSSADLSGASDWLRVVNRELPSLEELHLSDCQLPPVPSLLNVNLSSLAVLDLSDNYFTNQMDLGWLSKLNSLGFLHLGGNYFDGSIPDFLRNMSSSLRHLDLSSNDFNSSIPDWLYSFSALRVMRLGDNQLKGDISSAIGNMTSLDEFNLFGNELEGKLPRPVGKLCKLRSIDLSYMIWRQDISHILEILSGCSSTRLESLKFDSCLLSGQLTDQLEHFKNLKQLSLSVNSISGSIPTYLGKLANLERVYISNNLLQGVVSEKHFSNHTKLRRFDGSGNSLDLRVDPNWLPPFQLRHLYLGSWRIGPSFPSWLHSHKHLQYLDISNSSISDTIPSWFWRLSTQFSFLNLSTNHFSGPLPRISTGSTNVIDLSNNYFSGPLSHFLCNQLDRATITLILSNNLLSGEIPDCWIKCPSLIVLRLDGNRFTGGIPTSMGSLTSLRSLHLYNNRLHGEILPLKNCTNLVAIDLGNNELSGNIPGWLGYGLPNLLILILRSNKFRGNIPDHICALSSLQILDVTDNNLSGRIPRCISNFTAMVTREASMESDILYGYFSTGSIFESASVVSKSQRLEYGSTLNLVRILDLSRNNLSGEIPGEVTSLQGLQTLNLSQNRLIGKIPDNIGAMTSIETLDLSQNQLSGSIPKSMSCMTFLSHLNLSLNNLIGRIPTSSQLQSFNESCYARDHLCGPPLKDCRGNGKEPDVENGARGNRKGREVNWFYVSMPLGFVAGFWCVMGLLVFKTMKDHLLPVFGKNVVESIRFCE